MVGSEVNVDVKFVRYILSPMRLCIGLGLNVSQARLLCEVLSS